MSNNGRNLTAREKRAAEMEKLGPQRLGLSKSSSKTVEVGKGAPQDPRNPKSVPKAVTPATLAPKSRRPELERIVPIAVDPRSELPQTRRDGKRSTGDVVDESRKRPRDDKDKSPADGEDSNRSKRNEVLRNDRAVALPNSRDLFSDPAQAAQCLSRIVRPGIEFPSPGQMTQKDIYSNTALHCMTFLSSLNELAIDYELASRTHARQLDNAQRACGEFKQLKRDAEDKAKKLQDALKRIEDKRREMDGTFTEFESEKKRLTEEISALNVRLGDAAKLQDDAVLQAVTEAKREMTATYEAKIHLAVEKLRAVNDRPKTDIVDLAQVRSNIELVELLLTDKGPTLEDELIALKNQEAGLSHAEDVFEEHMRELKGILRGSLTSVTSATAAELSAPVEADESSSDSSDSSSDEDSASPEVAVPAAAKTVALVRKKAS